MSRLKRKEVTIGDETFTIRQWTPSERSAAFKSREVDHLLFSAFVAYTCTINEDGTRFFKSEKSLKDDEPAELADALCTEILKINTVETSKSESDEKKD